MKFNEIKSGEYLSTTMYLKVVNKTKDGVIVKNTQGQEFEVRGTNLLETTFKSAAQFVDTKKVTRTDLADILVNLGDQVFQVNFDKQDGTNRTLVGYKVSTENLMGRVNAIDLEVTGYAQRQIDLRTIKSLIVNNVKYQVK
jgi:hypothetical protein